MILFTFLFLLLPSVLLSKKCCPVPKADSTLVMAQVIFRHGARNIETLFPNDPWRSRKYWPEGYGQLTNLGKQQHYKLGKWFRKRYQERLFPHGYSVDKIYIQSTDVDRTIMSAGANLAGLFPPTEKQTWNEHLAWQPMPIHVVSPSTDQEINPLANPCPLHDELLEEYSAPFYAKYENIFSFAAENAGRNLSGLEKEIGLYDTLKVEKQRDRRIPGWADSIYNDLEKIALFAYQSYTATPEMARLRGGFLLKDILEKFENKTKSTLSPDRTFFMYSGHDTTVVNILNTLNLFDNDFVPYAASVLFELHQLNGVYYIQIFYRKNPTKTVTPLNIPNCGIKCPLDQFRQIYQAVIPTEDYEAECALSY